MFKAVYVDKRELKCRCVGGDSNHPLGFVSLTENLMMVGMAVWMIVKPQEWDTETKEAAMLHDPGEHAETEHGRPYVMFWLSMILGLAVLYVVRF